MMHLVRHSVERPRDATAVAVPVERLTLAKSRWRGTAADGVEFGFDLAQPLRHGDCIFIEGDRAYCIAQLPEPVLELALPVAPEVAAQLGWQLGNLHQPIQVEPGLIRVADDPAARQLLDLQRIPYAARVALFVPFRSAAGHHHHVH